MSRKKKPRQSRRPPRPTPQSEPEPSVDNVVQTTTTAFTCSHRVVEDFVLYCDEETERMDMNVDFGEVAGEIWSAQHGRGPVIVEAISEYIAACKRHREAVVALRDRFAALVRDDVHEHVEHVEPARDLIRRRLYTPAST